MSVNTRSPLRLIGGVNLSGQINDGSQQMTYGGMRAFSAFSGGLLTLGSGTQGAVSVPGTAHVVVTSGPGRLNTLLAHQIISGVQVTFYDSNVAALSGVAVGIAGSGMTIIGIIPANTLGAYGNSLGGGPLPLQVGVPYYNGIGVSCGSGATGFTVTFTPSNESYSIG